MAQAASGKKGAQVDERFLALPTTRAGIVTVLAQSRQVFDRHTHDAYVFGCIHRGGQRWHSGRGQVEGRAGDLIMSNPGEVHDGSPLYGASRAWRMLHVDPAVMLAAVGQLGVARPQDYEFCNPVVEDRTLGRVMNRLVHAVSRQRASILLVDELFLYVIGKLGQIRAASVGEKHSRIERARSRLDDDPAHPHTLAELATECDLSSWQLLRSFVQETGFTPHAYQIQRRIELTRKLIAEGVSLAAASAHSGFADQSHMTRIFRRKYGFSPGAWARWRREQSGHDRAGAIPF